MAKLLVLTMLVAVLSAEYAKEISVAQNKSTEASEIEPAEQIVENEYYSDDDDEYELKVKSFRDTKSKIVLAVVACSFLGSLMIIIVLIHRKSRKVSQLLHLI